MAKIKGFRKDIARAAPSPSRSAPDEPIVAPERYPAPSYAAHVWLTPDGLRVGLPAALGESGHTILLPFKDASWSVLCGILRERARFADRRDQRTIGHRAAPVQYDIEAILRAMGSSAPTPHRIERQRTLTLDDL
jgi:hypothetical protein